MTPPCPPPEPDPTRGLAFLRANWNHLILANYPCPDHLLKLPPGLELDRRDGSAFVSLVGFSFLDTRVMGIGWPRFRHFPEWNLRFYVRHSEQRGVCFVREFVPQRLVAWLARSVYNEPYVAVPMNRTITESEEAITAEYGVEFGGRWHTLKATGAKPAVRPAADSVAHFFKEHQWGFGITRRGRTLRYEVRHPRWDVFPVRDFAIEVDWGLLYGPAWRTMQDVTPQSVVFAVGSAVAVYPKGRLWGDE